MASDAAKNHTLKGIYKETEATIISQLLERCLTEEMLTDIDPKTAQMLLDKRLKTRSIRQPDVSRYANSMKSERWKSAASAPVCITKKGELADGQHRMSAVVRAGKTIPFYIQLVKATDIDVMDTGVRRTGADVVFQEVPDIAVERAKSYFTALLWTCRYNDPENYTLRLDRLTNDQIREEIPKYPDIRKSVDFVHQMAPKNGALLAKGQAAFIHHLFAKIDKLTADQFIERLYKGIELTEGHVLHTLRERFIEDKFRAEKLPLHTKTAMAIKAWNAMRTNNKNAPLKELEWVMGRDFPRAHGEDLTGLTSTGVARH